VTRLRCAVILLAALLWNISSPWLAIGRVAPPEATVIGCSPHPSGGSEWLPGAAAGEQLARLPAQQGTAPSLATVAVPGGLPTRRGRSLGPPPPLLHPVYPRPHTVCAADDRDEPS
jgi:hypothetical protein